MSSAHEIVTIQAGNFANFIGTHWWNIQESSFCYTPDSSIPLDINHDVMFREGLNLRGEVTYTPRLILVDLQDNLTSIRKECPLYRSPTEDDSKPLWDGQVEVIKDEAVKKNPFLDEFEKLSNPSANNADETEKKEKKISNEISSSIEKTPFNLYSNGEDLYERSGKEMIEDGIRRMTEECDFLQGFHLLFDAHNGFSGISNNILQYLEDEYKRIPSLCFPVFQEKGNMPIQDIKDQMNRLYAVLNSMSNLNRNCSLFSPLSLSDDIVTQSEPYKNFPFIDYNPNLLYQTSAIYATAIETLTSPFRLKAMKFTMSDITSSMSTYGRKLVCSSTCLPFPLSHDAYLSSMVEKDVPEYYMTSLTPFYKPDSERTLFQSSVLRGVPRNRFQKPGKSLFRSSEYEEIFGEYLNKYSPSSATTATVFTEKVSIDVPFPKIFKSAVSDCDLNKEGGSKVPMAASFCNSDSSGDFIENILSQATKLSFKEYVKCTEATYEKDNYIEIIENLRGLQDNYLNY
ncbi:Protein misato like protein [Argiope bruennichi]|uniref:Protein misato like protein n=1 Tax=Argiope bruennichi TaxID=94029 RepID=A0A8T0FX49_ARGBR|nr:Protein misato like protein [Argiope bruennichi]